MPGQTTTSGLLAKLGDRARQAFETYKNNEIEWGSFGELPPGIENGVARLAECKFGLFKDGDNKGEPFFMAQGIVITPKEVTTYGPDGKPNGVVHVEGLRTRIGPEPLCETPKRTSRKTVDEHLQWVVNEMKKLGVPMADLGLDDLETAAAALTVTKPYFKFRTWRGKPSPDFPDPRTNHVWNGECQPPPAESEGTPTVQDQSRPGTLPGAGPNGVPSPMHLPSPRAEGAAPAGPTPRGVVGPSPRGSVPSALTPPVPTTFDEFGDLDSLVARAKQDDGEAQATLRAMVLKAGGTNEDVDGAPSWEEVANLASGANRVDPVAAAGGLDEESPAAEEPAWVPAVGDVFLYKLLDPKTGKPFIDPKTKRERKPVEVDVLTVDEKAQTVTAKNLDTGKEVMGPNKKPLAIKWDDLDVPS